MHKSSTSRKRVRWSAQEAQAVLDEQARSGLSVLSFAEREGLEAERLYRWRRRLRGVVDAPVEFVEVKASNGVPLEVVLRSGHRVLVRGTVDVSALRAVVVALEQEC